MPGSKYRSSVFRWVTEEYEFSSAVRFFKCFTRGRKTKVLEEIVQFYIENAKTPVVDEYKRYLEKKNCPSQDLSFLAGIPDEVLKSFAHNYKNSSIGSVKEKTEESKEIALVQNNTDNDIDIKTDDKIDTILDDELLQITDEADDTEDDEMLLDVDTSIETNIDDSVLQSDEDSDDDYYGSLEDCIIKSAPNPSAAGHNSKVNDKMNWLKNNPDYF